MPGNTFRWPGCGLSSISTGKVEVARVLVDEAVCRMARPTGEVFLMVFSREKVFNTYGFIGLGDTSHGNGRFGGFCFPRWWDLHNQGMARAWCFWQPR